MRMGGADKTLLSVGNRLILEHVIERLAPQVDCLAINANGDPTRFQGFGLPVLPDQLPEQVPEFPGPLAGILAGLEWASGLGAEAVVTVAGDTPFFPRQLVTVLEVAAFAANRPCVVSFSVTRDGTLQCHPVFGRWPVGLRMPLREALVGGMRRVTDFAEASGHGRAVFYDPDGFLNANTPMDVEALRARIAR